MRRAPSWRRFQTARWTPASADTALGQLLEQLRTYMEWTALPAGQGLAYTAPAAPLAYLHGLGSALTFFLGEKGVLGPAHLPPGPAGLLRAAQANPDHVAAQLALVALLLRQKAAGTPLETEAHRHACAWLASAPAQSAGVAALAAGLA